MMIRSLALACVASAVMTNGALAQEVAAIHDEPGVGGLPEDASFDILGVQLGMTPDEAEAASGMRLRTVPGHIFLSDPETGGEFLHEYEAQLESVARPLIGNERFTAGQDDLTVELGTEAVGGRVVSVRRFYSPPQNQPIGTEAVRQLLIDKYGEPTGENARGTTMAWLYGPDGKVTSEFFSDEIDYRGLMDYVDAGAAIDDDLEPLPCILSFRTGVSDGLNPYEYQPERELRDPDCVAGLLVRLSGAEQLRNMTLLMVDGQRRIQNAEGLDAAVEASLASGAAPANAPKL